MAADAHDPTPPGPPPEQPERAGRSAGASAAEIERLFREQPIGRPPVFEVDAQARTDDVEALVQQDPAVGE